MATAKPIEPDVIDPAEEVAILYQVYEGYWKCWMNKGGRQLFSKHDAKVLQQHMKTNPLGYTDIKLANVVK